MKSKMFLLKVFIIILIIPAFTFGQTSPQIVNFTTADGLAHNKVKAIVIDAEGNKWFGTEGGVSKFDGTIWITYTTSDGLANNKVQAIAIDDAGNKWFGTDNGVSKFNGTIWMTYTTDDGLVNNRVKAIAIDSEGNKWFGSEGGVSKFDGTTWTTYTTDDGLVLNKVRAIAIDAEGNKWFGTEGGVSKFGGTTWTTYNTDDGLVLCKVRAITIDSEGNKWFGAEGGVSKFDGTAWTTYTTDEGLVNNKVKPVAIDTEGNKWFGTEGGVSKFDGTTWTTYTKDDGLAHNKVKAIAIDGTGNKWFGTDDGVSKFVTSPLMVDNLTPPVINVIPNSLDFQSVTVGESDSLVLWIYNTGDDSLEITEISTKSPFSVTPSEYTLEQSDSVQVTIIFNPQNPNSFSEQLKIYSNDLDNQVIEIEIEGEGVTNEPEPPNPIPPVIKGIPSEQNIDASSVTINWTTNKPSTSNVYIHRVEGESDTLVFSDYSFVIEHSVDISGLMPGSQYEYWVSSVDESGNIIVLNNVQSFNTLALPDVTPPQITFEPNILSITHNCAMIIFETDELSIGSIRYGTDSTLGTVVSDSTEKTIHRIHLTGLTESTLYYYKLEVTDLEGNGTIFPIESGELLTFKTKSIPAAQNVGPLRIIEGPVELDINSDRMTIFWKTNKASNSTVEYGTSTDLSQATTLSELSTNHKVSLTNLSADTKYYYRVRSLEMHDHEIVSEIFSVNTLAVPDTSPPVILAGPIANFIESNKAAIWWQTDKISSSRVDYGVNSLNLDEFEEANESDGVIKHLVQLTGLQAEKTYFYRVSSIAENGSIVVSGLSHFTTTAIPDTIPPHIITGPDPTSIRNTSVTIEWTTDELSTSVLHYWLYSSDDPNPTEMVWLNDETAGVNHHKAVLTGLTSGAEYFYYIINQDISARLNKSVSKTKHFTTNVALDNNPPVLIAGPIVDPTDKTATFEWETDKASDSFVYIRMIDLSGFPIEQNFRKIGNASKVKLHIITVTNLKAGTRYEYKLTSRDFEGNLFSWPTAFIGVGFSAAFTLGKTAQPPGGGGTFFTDQNPDTQQPIILEGPTVVAKTVNSITVQWKTDERSNSFVNYGLTTAYGLIKGDAANVTAHNIILTNLTSSTLYNFNVSSTDASNNGPTLSGNAVVSTEAEADNTPPRITAGPVVESITDDQATIIWETDEIADTYVEYGLTTDYGNVRISTEHVKIHVLTLTNLTASTEYHFRVASTDISDNGPTMSEDLTFTTANTPDVTPPVITEVNAAVVTDRSATITYKTNELGDTFVNYGLTPSFGFTVGNAQDVIDHEITLTNLLPDTTYYYRVGSIDKSGNETILDLVQSFKTHATPDTVPPAVPSGLKVESGNNQLLLMWNMNSEADFAGYNIFRNSGAGFQIIETNVADTLFYDTGLTNGKEYQYKLTAVDNSNNVSDESAVVSNIPAAENSPTSPTLLYPINGECVDNTEVILYVLNSIKPQSRDELRYEFVEAEGPDFINQAAYVDNIPEGEQYTAWNSAVTLIQNQTYYWKVRAFDGYFYSDWSEPEHFVVNSQIVTGIELVDFHGEENDCIVLLVWETSSNNNAAGFDLYRSMMKDKGYTKITSETIESGEKNFSYTDEAVEAGYTYYYKLAALSNSGITREFNPIEVEVKTPRTHELHQNYPNPFNPVTTIRYELARQVRVRIKVYNLLGQEIKDIFDGHKKAGYHVIQWDGTDSFGNPVGSGIYIYRIIAGEFTRAKKMMLIR